MQKCKIKLRVNQECRHTGVQLPVTDMRKEVKKIRLKKSAIYPVHVGDRVTVLQFLDNKRLFELCQQYLAKDKMEANELLMVRRFLMGWTNVGQLLSK